MFDFFRNLFSLKSTQGPAESEPAPDALTPALTESRLFSIRRATVEDLDTLLKLEHQSKVEDMFEPDDFLYCLDNPRKFRLVLAQIQEPGSTPQPIGYLAAAKHKKGWWIGALTIELCFHREGYGSKLLDYLKDLSPQRQDFRLMTNVRESDLDSQLFLKANGFLCCGQGQLDFADPPETAFYFLWSR